ncbi:MAG TPA: S9 family peptidase [Candidatus Dormibacteraeota bacterium]
MTRLSLESFWTIPRVNSLLVSPDGRRLVLGIQTLSPDTKKFVSSLWELPADGSASARRLTYSEKGEGAHAFLPDGSLLFASARPDVTVKEDDADGRLFRLPAGGGEAEPVLSVAGGVEAIVTADRAPVAVLRVPVFPDAPGLAEDAAKAKNRKEAGVSGVLFDKFPIRYWDHDVGPRQSRLLRVDLGGEKPVTADLTQDAGNALHEASYDVAADGAFAASGWLRNPSGVELSSDLVLVEEGRRRVIADGADFEGPAISPDGRFVAAVRDENTTTEEPGRGTLWLVDLESGQGRDLAPDFAQRPGPPVWAPDGRSLYFAADENGRCPIFSADVESGVVRRLAAAGAYTSIHPSPDGAFVYALRSSFESPAQAVRIDVSTGEETVLPTPGQPLELPGRVEELVAKAPDGVDIHAWLVLPEGASPQNPAPLLLWIHGGPYNSWNAWAWRWSPHLMAERGYAVLMPDPALSTGYGYDFLRRAHKRYGQDVWPDLEASLDAALSRPDLDASRTAAMGGSFGGYMTNWVAGHTDRFKALVTHASLWDMEQFVATTDTPHWWERQFGPLDQSKSPYEAVSPRSTVDEIRTPMLIVHGQLDYRVPISEALKLYTDLRRRGVPSRFLYYPDENHWILKPGNSRLWYETVLAFLDEHVLGAGWRSPELL